MFLDVKEEKRRILAKGISLIIGGIGLYILWVVWLPMITSPTFGSFFDIIFLFIFPIPATCLAIYFFHTAKSLWAGLSSKGVCKLAVSLSFIFAALSLSTLDSIALSLLDKPVWNIAKTPLLMIMSGLFYLFVKKGLFGLFSIQQVYDHKANSRATKLYFGVLAFIIWSSVLNIVELLLRGPDFERVPENVLLSGLIVFGSIPLAFLFYRIGVKIFLKKPCTQTISDENQESKSEAFVTES